jgi:predicted dehydrogenase
MRVAVAGIGYWGSKHVRVLNTLDEVDEVVCVDRRPVVPSSGRMLCCTDLSEALSEVDAVVVATPPSTHAEVARQAIDAGKHVLVEKPFTTTPADARDLVEAADHAGVVLMVGHTYAYHGIVQELRSLIHNQALGELHYLDTARLNLGLYRPDVSVIWDLAAHDVSILNYLLDSTPDTIGARAGHVTNRRVDDIAYIWLEYHDRRVVAMCHVSWLDPCKVRRITAVGSSRMAVLDDLAAEAPLKLYDKGVEFIADATGDGEPFAYRYGDVVAPYLPFEEPLLVEDRHFLQCIRTGSKPLTDGREGLTVVEVLTAADESIRRGRTVELDEIKAGAL